MAKESMIQQARRAMLEHGDKAQEAYGLFVSHCEDVAPCRVPGMDTVIRFAIRIDCGRDVENAAAREYIYRWNLALQSVVAFGAPHLLGA